MERSRTGPLAICSVALALFAASTLVTSAETLVSRPAVAVPPSPMREPDVFIECLEAAFARLIDSTAPATAT